MSEKQSYVKPSITGEQVFETRAMACAKVPGLGDRNFCGRVWIGATGRRRRPGCSMNTNSRSS